jgi:hypothetical protein
MRSFTAGLLWLVVALVTTGARAADPVEEAQEAFEEGKRLAAAGELDEACALLEKSQALAPASGTLLNLADCYEQLGKTATAWASFRAAAAAARLKGQDARAEEALARALALEPRLSRLRVVVTLRVASMTILRGEAIVEPSLWGVAVPVDPGTHVVRARAPDHHEFEREVEVAAGPGVVEVVVPELEAAPGAEVAPDQSASSDGTRQQIFGLVVGGVGIAAIGVGVGFGIDALFKNDRSNDAGCRDNLCPPAGLALRQAAVTEAHVATALTVAGLVHVASGLALLLTAPEAEVAVVSIDRGAMLSLGGRF